MAATLRQDVCDLSNPRGSVGRVRASIVRQGDIPDHDAKSTKELKKTRDAADTAPARPGFAGRVFWMRASARSAPRYARRRVFLDAGPGGLHPVAAQGRCDGLRQALKLRNWQKQT